MEEVVETIAEEAIVIAETAADKMIRVYHHVLGW